MAYPETVKNAVSDYVKSQSVIQANLAERLGMSSQSLSNKLNGKTDFTVSELKNLADLIGVDIGELVK